MADKHPGGRPRHPVPRKSIGLRIELRALELVDAWPVQLDRNAKINQLIYQQLSADELAKMDDEDCRPIVDGEQPEIQSPR
jgi:hypothetical protein